MGDRTTYTVEIAGVDDAYQVAIGRWLEEQWSAEDDTQGTWYCHDMSIGHTGEIAAGLERLMVELDQPFAFRITEDPVYEWDGSWFGSIPGPDGPWEESGGSDGSGNTHVDVAAIDTLLDTWEATRAARVAEDFAATLRFEHVDPPDVRLAGLLNQLTGRAWRLAWDLLDADLGEPTNPVEDRTDIDWQLA